MARGLPRSRRARTLESDDGRRRRRDRRPDDPHRRPVARRLRLLQLPGLRSRPRDHRLRAARARALGHPSKLVAPARQPGPLRADRRALDGARRSRGRPRLADDHPDSHVGDPGARRRRDDLRRPARAQDDLRRRSVRGRARRDGEALPPRRPGRPRAPAEGERQSPAADLRRRGQQHDRKRSRHRSDGSSGSSPRRPALRRRRTRIRRHRRTELDRAQPLRVARKRRRQARRRVL